jgi:hypothetical protein
VGVVENRSSHWLPCYTQNCWNIEFLLVLRPYSKSSPLRGRPHSWTPLLEFTKCPGKKENPQSGCHKHQLWVCVEKCWKLYNYAHGVGPLTGYPFSLLFHNLSYFVRVHLHLPSNKRLSCVSVINKNKNKNKNKDEIKKTRTIYILINNLYFVCRPESRDTRPLHVLFHYHSTLSISKYLNTWSITKPLLSKPVQILAFNTYILFLRNYLMNVGFFYKTNVRQ